jgi:ACS family tartrate transporter-like MFS transporter
MPLIGTADKTIEAAAMQKVTWRIVPFLMVCFFFSLLDRVNIGFAALQMNKDLHLSPAVFGVAASMFFISYFLLEIPSNLAMQKVGARRWLSRILVSWGLASACTAFAVGPYSLCAMRFLLGAAEAGFFPGALLYLTYWFPSEYRARIVGVFAVSIPLASFLGSPVSASLLGMGGLLGLKGWQWLFLCEAVPTVLLGFACLAVLTDRPAGAKWLTPEERDWLTRRLEAEGTKARPVGHIPLWQLLRNKYVLVLTLVGSGASAAGTTLSIWQPQILKSFGLTTMRIGLLNSIPYGLASIIMILWGRHSDRSQERRWHTAAPLALIAVGLVSTFLTRSLVPTIFMLSLALIGAYSFKGPFWALASGWLSSSTTAAGLAGINATANLVGGGMISLVGLIKGATGSYSIALLPLVALNAAGSISLLLVSRSYLRKAAVAPATVR